MAAVALPAGFAVAQATGVRPLGGLVMAGLLAAAAWRRRGTASLGAQLAMVGIAVLAFGSSHALAPTLGAWGAVALAAAVVGLAAFALLDRRAA